MNVDWTQESGQMEGGKLCCIQRRSAVCGLMIEGLRWMRTQKEMS